MMSPQHKTQSSNIWKNLIVQCHPIDALNSLSTISSTDKAKLIFLDFPPYVNDVNYDPVMKSPYLKSLDASNHTFFNLFIKGSSNRYFQAIRNLVQAAKELLSSDGFLCLKAIGSKRHYLKAILDQVLGFEQFVNEICINSPLNLKYCQNQRFVESTGSLFLYSLSPNPQINAVRKKVIRGGYWHTMHSKGQGDAKSFTFHGKKVLIVPPTGNHWKFKQETIDKMCQEGKIKLNSRGQPLYWVEASEGQIIDSLWLDLQSFHPSSLGFDTSEDLITRLLQLTTQTGNLFIHIFCGEGYGLLAAEKTGCRWIGIDTREIPISLLKMKLKEVKEDFSVALKIWTEDDLL
ncbi:MAG: DNA methyltransferase [Candidatus Hodarchaeota archaeon]